MYRMVQLGLASVNMEVIRDVLVVCMLFLFMLRGSSVAALNFSDVKLQVVEGHTSITVTARYVKNQTEPVHWTFYTATCPEVYRLFRRYLDLKVHLYGTLQPVSLWQLPCSPQSVFHQPDLEPMLHRCLRAVGFSELQLVGMLTHSGRIGGASAMNAAGLSREVIRVWGKWATQDMLDIYVMSVPSSPRNAFFFGWMLASPPAFR